MSEVQYRNVAFAVALKTTVIATVLVILGLSGWAPWLRLIGSGVGLVVVAVIASWYTDRQQRFLRRGERIVFSLGVGLAVCLPFIGHEHFWFLVSLGASVRSSQRSGESGSPDLLTATPKALSC